VQKQLAREYALMTQQKHAEEEERQHRFTADLTRLKREHEAYVVLYFVTFCILTLFDALVRLQ
jgi:hypothetical protein